MRLVLSNVYEAISKRTESSQECENLAHVVKRAEEKIEELNDLIEHSLIKNGKDGSIDEKPRASRTAFLRYQRKINSLKSELREVKLSLVVSVGTLTL